MGQTTSGLGIPKQRENFGWSDQAKGYLQQAGGTLAGMDKSKNRSETKTASAAKKTVGGGIGAAGMGAVAGASAGSAIGSMGAGAAQGSSAGWIGAAAGAVIGLAAYMFG